MRRTIRCLYQALAFPSLLILLFAISVTAKAQEANLSAYSRGILLTNDLISYYDFSESDSGRIRNLANENYGDLIVIGNAKINGVLNLNGNTQRVQSQPNEISWLEPISNELTIEYWANPTSSVSSTIIGRDNGTNRIWKSGIYSPDPDNTRLVYHEFFGSAAQGQFQAVKKPEGKLKLNTWHHIVLTYGSKERRLFVNGKLIQSLKISANPLTGKAPLSIGGRSDDKEYFTGMIDDVAIYSRPLTANEVATHSQLRNLKETPQPPTPTTPTTTEENVRLNETDIDKLVRQASPVVDPSGATLYQLSYVAKALLKADNYGTSATVFLKNLSTRKWTDSSKTFELEAEFYGFNAEKDKVLLKTVVDGDSIKEVRIDQLSKEDQLICKMFQGNITKFSYHENAKQFREQADTKFKYALLRSQFTEDQQKYIDRTFLNTDMKITAENDLVRRCQNRLYLYVKQKPISDLYHDRIRKVNLEFLFDIYIPYTVYLEAFRNFPFNPSQSASDFLIKLNMIKTNLEKYYNFTDDSIWDIFCHINNVGPNVEALNLATVPGFLAWWKTNITDIDEDFNNRTIALEWARIGAEIYDGDYSNYKQIVSRTSPTDLKWLINTFHRMPETIRLARLYYPTKKGEVLTYKDTFKVWYVKLVNDKIIAP